MAERLTEDLPDDSGPHSLVERVRCKVVAGPDKGASHTSRGRRLSIGTHDSNDGFLVNNAVSNNRASALDIWCR